LNPINHAPGDQQHVTVAELKTLQNDSEPDWAREPDRKFFLAYDFNAVDSWLYHDPEHYPLFGGGNLRKFKFINFIMIITNRLLQWKNTKGFLLPR